MGNSMAGYERPEHRRIASLEKELPYLSVTQNPRKKRSIIFHTGAWKRFVESTRKRGSKMKINPSQTCLESGVVSEKSENSEHSGRYEKGAGEKPPSCFVINTKEIPPASYVTANANPKVITHFQQPPSRGDSGYRSVTSNVSDKHTEAFAAKSSYLRLNNNNVDKENSPVKQRVEKAPSYREVVKHDKQRKINPLTDSHRKILIQASTAELLQRLGEYVCRKCPYASTLEPRMVVSWLRAVDRDLLSQGWQDISFIMPSSVVFVYMLCRDVLSEDMVTVSEVRANVVTCLYMSYSYMGNEISYPLRPFLVDNDRYALWARCCKIMDLSSGKMLRINKDTQYFTKLIKDLAGRDTVTPVDQDSLVRSRKAVYASRPQNGACVQNAHHAGRSERVRIAMTAGAY